MAEYYSSSAVPLLTKSLITAYCKMQMSPFHMVKLWSMDTGRSLMSASALQNTKF